MEEERGSSEGSWYLQAILTSPDHQKKGRSIEQRCPSPTNNVNIPRNDVSACEGGVLNLTGFDIYSRGNDRAGERSLYTLGL